mmetsp:Transcript_33004/g.91046  ORF Transcript_33004/g.91046 Transcript_33004/m.91046 type:complete len:529 (-) Transcript_33004:185-1771(-)
MCSGPQLARPSLMRAQASHAGANTSVKVEMYHIGDEDQAATASSKDEFSDDAHRAEASDPRATSEAKGYQRNAEETSAAAIVVLVRGRVMPQVVNGMSFAMGLAWQSAVLVSLRPGSFLSESDSEDIGALWAATAIMCTVLVPLIALLQWRRSSLKRRAKEAMREGDAAKFLLLQATDRSYEAMVGWGFTFAVAAQVDSAVDASLPSSHAVWRIVYFVALLEMLSVPTIILQMFFPSSIARHSVVASTIDSLLTGSTYVVVLSFFRLTVALFHVQNVVQSEDLGFLMTYTGCFLLFSAISLLVLGVKDTKESEAEFAKQWREYHEEQQQPLCCIRLFWRIHRRFISSVIAMAAGCVVYATISVLLARLIAGGTASVHDPLPTDLASGLLGLSLLLSVLCGFVLERETGLEKKLASFDFYAAEENLDDAAVASLQALSQITKASVTMALAWLVGCSFHGLASAVWRDIFDQGNYAHSVQACAAIGFALILTALAVLASLLLPPPPLQIEVATAFATSEKRTAKARMDTE